MDDLLGLSWDQKGPRQGANGAGMTSGKVKPMPPPPTSKPAHLQMGLSKAGLVPTPTSSNSFPAPQPHRNNNNGVISPSPAASQKKNADDVFGSLMPAFGTSNVTKSLNSMSLDERRRHDQQQQSHSWGSLSSSPTPAAAASPFSSSSFNSSSSGLSQPSRSTFSPAMNSSSSAPRGYDPGNLAGLQRPIATSSPQPIPGFASPIPKLPQPLSSQQQQQPFNLSRHQSPAGGYLVSPGLLGRSLSPAMTPLQPERSNNSSPSTITSTPTISRDPFDSLLGDQVSRSSPSLKNQSLNSIRNNTPPIGQPATKAADPWDLDFLASASVTKPAQAPVSNNNDVFDLGSFESAPPQKPTRQRDSVDALNSFIGKQPLPAGSPSQRTSPPTSREPAVKPPRSTTASKPTSREDADIAQIVSMGFSAERARLALAMTENGRDIEAAIEYLVQNDEAEDQLPSRRRNQGTKERGQEERRPYRDGSDPALEDRRRRNQDRGQALQQQEQSRAQQLQQQKDKLVGTASVFGMSVLSKANEFYKQGRDKVQAAMGDMTAEEPKSTAARRHQWVEDEFKPSRGQYKDSDSEEDEVYRGRREQQRQQEQRQQQQQQQQHQRQQQQQQVSRPRQEKEAFQDTYVSSSRRGGASASRNQQPLFSMDDSPSKQKTSMSTPTFSSGSKPSTPSSASRATRAPSPLPPKPARPLRTLVQASSQQLAESNHYKEKGNEGFKLGQFGQAAEFYARAGQSLPFGHILLIVTQNNRAAALLKIGEYRETVSICDKTILQVQGPDGQGVLDVLPENAGVNLKDQMGKALMRRATAHENLEKYKEARDDWAKLKELDPGHRNAAEGQRRCEKAIALVNGGGADGFAQPAAKKPAVSAARQGGMSASSPMQDMFVSQRRTNNDAKVKAELERSEGVSKLRQSAAKQEKDEDEKLRLTDQVEMKMTMWKSGKEDNIRALISSLGSVLWEGVGWKPVGLHELVTPSQVKIKYMRAIGKMHPDKLSASTTIEQRMMANTIFSTLNSAWDAFKVQNNM
ncbi:MAG: hypothetical protein J3R72DRAFT_387739 [Linnemannia gamsii]|nr:MAG: hypothetical protein J3R72DRAFT_387739 [Linnemannia gamsii]